MEDTERRPLLQNSKVNGEVVVKTSYMKNAYFVLVANIILTFASAGFNSTLSVFYKDYLGFSENAASAFGSGLMALGSAIGLFGGIVSDTFLGPLKTLLLGLSCLAFSQVLLAVVRILYSNTISEQLFRTLSIVMIVVYFLSGFYKPCISTLMGNQFLPEEEKQRSTFVAWYYLSIQIGAVVASILFPVILQEKAHKERPNGFTNDGLFIIYLSVFAMLCFAMITLFIPWKKYMRKTSAGNVFVRFLRIVWAIITKKTEKHAEKDVKDAKQVLSVFKIFATLPFFWAIYQLSQFMWVYQAEAMNRIIHLPGGKTWEVPYNSISSLNPLMDIFLIPFFASVFFPLTRKIKIGGKPLIINDLHKIGAGMVFSAGALIAQGVVQAMMAKNPVIKGDPTSGVSVWWISIQFLFVSVAEILIAVSAYDFAYSQATPDMRGTVTAVWILVTSIGFLMSSIYGYIPMDPSHLCYVLSGLQILLLFVFIWIAKGYTIKRNDVEEVQVTDES
eukprot:TRINITY_DN4722_c0_g1_i1.p1 TRINITY_DN4722_c0_g1~~TRINITY_DN4722_c0_g1_i1.p1  ORF type:complete len:503 (-),score=148.69 TRINITY_DN4722_c0_g1_i1:41-1549(-)